MRPPSTIDCNACHTALVAVSGGETTAINCSSRPHNKCGVTGGFTLIELSIVLVIIGLLVGGVLVGKDLILSSQIRAQIKQLEDFKSAINTFKGKYNYLPGDMPPSEASQLGFFTFTGTYAGKSYSVAQCCGLGNITYGFGNNDGDINRPEYYVFWQHLSEAKLIAGQYGGSASTNYLQPDSSTYTTGGMPVNAATFPAGYTIFLPTSKLTPPTVVGTSNYLIYAATNHQSTLVTWAGSSTLNNIFQLSIFPSHQYTIDTKIDDGFPASGVVRASTTLNPCVVFTTPVTYDMSAINNNTGNCIGYFLW